MKTKNKIRWLDDDREAEQVISISEIAFRACGISFDLAQIQAFVQTEGCVPKVLVADGRVLAYNFFKLYKKVVKIQQLAVRHELRRQSLGSRMLRRLIDDLPGMKKKAILVEVPEEHLGAQLFFRSHGFEAIQIKERCGQTFYAMQYIA